VHQETAGDPPVTTVDSTTTSSSSTGTPPTAPAIPPLPGDGDGGGEGDWEGEGQWVWQDDGQGGGQWVWVPNEEGEGGYDWQGPGPRGEEPVPEDWDTPVMPGWEEYQAAMEQAAQAAYDNPANLPQLTDAAFADLGAMEDPNNPSEPAVQAVAPEGGAGEGDGGSGEGGNASGGTSSAQGTGIWQSSPFWTVVNTMRAWLGWQERNREKLPAPLRQMNEAIMVTGGAGFGVPIGVARPGGLPAPRPIMTQWGWTGSNSWNEVVKVIAAGGEFRAVGGKVPTYAEAIRLLEEAGCTVVRTDPSHAGSRVAGQIDYPHINYVTKRGTRGHLGFSGQPPQ